MGEHGGQNYALVQAKVRTISAVLSNFEDNCDVGSIQRQSFFNSLLDRVFVRSLIVLEAPNL